MGKINNRNDKASGFLSDEKSNFSGELTYASFGHQINATKEALIKNEIKSNLWSAINIVRKENIIELTREKMRFHII